MKGKRISSTGISMGLSRLRSLLQLGTSANSPVPPSPDSTSESNHSKTSFNEETWLQIAALFSVFLHLGLLILLPAPGNRGVLPAQTGPMTVQFLAPKPEPQPDPPAETEPEIPEEEPEPVVEEAENPAEEMPVDPVLAPPASIPIATAPSLPALPDLPLDGPAEPESPAEDGEIERIQSLLAETLQQSKSDKARDRWLMLDVREPIRRGLSELQGRGVSVSAAAGQGKFLLSFWIDSGGWIYDLSLKPAPGVEIDAFGIRDMIAGLNPLTPAPAGVKTPIKLQLRVQSLE